MSRNEPAPPEEPTGKKRVCLFVDRAEYARLQTLARRHGKSASELVRALIAGYVRLKSS